MNWRYKALAQWAFSILPGGESLNYLAQVYLTGSLPIRAEGLTGGGTAIARAHLDAIGRVLRRPLADLRFYEFGAGWHFSTPLLYWCLGVEKQILIDLRPLARANVINHTIAAIQESAEALQLERIPAHYLTQRALRSELMTYYCIDYRAPCDARDTGLLTGSIDCITSTSTLEHIARPDLDKILSECARILAPDGVASMVIDYKDHYSYFDCSISEQNFRRYSERHWSLYNPPLHYQNRLRHRDYVDAARRAGFVVVEEHTVEGSDEGLGATLNGRLSEEFRACEVRDLTVRESHLVLKKSPSNCHPAERDAELDG